MAAVPPSAAATAQQAQQQPAGASQGVDWDLVLATAGHLLDQRDVCALLGTSTAVAACVARSCRGQLAVQARPTTLQQAQVLADWLGKHSSLPRTLDVEPKLSGAEHAIEGTAHTALCGVLSSLTGLQSLHYWSLWSQAATPSASALAAAIHPLTRLTEFCSGATFNADDMRLFPASLQRVGVGFCGWWEPGPRQMLRLGHLTAVTDLDLGALNEDGLFAGPDGDVLPPNLVRLRGTFSGVEVLKGLPSLKHLDGPYVSSSIVAFAAAGLAGQLTHVGLRVSLTARDEVLLEEDGTPQAVDASFGLADAVKRLQEAGAAGIVRAVELESSFNDDTDEEAGVELSPGVVAELRRLPHLQSLRLVEEETAWAVDVDRLPDLTQLTSLGVPVRWSSDDYAALPGVLARLPSLREVVMRQPGPDVPAAVSEALVEGLAGLSHLRATLWA